MLCVAASCRKMAGKQETNSLNSVHKGIRELTSLKARPHRFNHFAPKILSAFSVNTDIS
jgi:hypothetical protein